MKKTDKKKIEELYKKYNNWLDTDIVKAGHNFNTIERKNEAFARGWRFAMLEIIRDLEELT